jgi:hypothetical protein
MDYLLVCFQVWRLQAALGEQSEITKCTQQEYERLQNVLLLVVSVFLLACLLQEYAFRNSEPMVTTESAFEICRDLSWSRRPSEGSLVHDMQFSRSRCTSLGKEVPSLGPFIQFGNLTPL